MRRPFCELSVNFRRAILTQQIGYQPNLPKAFERTLFFRKELYFSSTIGQVDWKIRLPFCRFGNGWLEISPSSTLEIKSAEQFRAFLAGKTLNQTRSYLDNLGASFYHHPR
jgi:hypothetical protein